ncbi:hypothetical protein [Streptomyces fructofermentans]|uniref:hypothetical protein n=1 Tax=Streptomyces fructofermentans TaxID=152141 RepID=UPI00378AEB6C
MRASTSRNGPAATTLRIDFGTGPTTGVANPWRADLLTSSHSTGIRTIDTCTALPAPMRVLMKLAARMPAVFASSPWRGITHARVRRLPPGAE